VIVIKFIVNLIGVFFLLALLLTVHLADVATKPLPALQPSTPQTGDR